MMKDRASLRNTKQRGGCVSARITLGLELGWVFQVVGVYVMKHILFMSVHPLEDNQWRPEACLAWL